MVRRREKRRRNKSPAAYQQHHSNSTEQLIAISSKRLRSRGDDSLRVVTVPHFACPRHRVFENTLRKLLAGSKKAIKATLVLVSTDPSELASAPFTSNDRSMIMGANTQLAAAARGANVDETRLYLFGKSEKEFSGAHIVLLFSQYTEADGDDEGDEGQKNAERSGKRVDSRRKSPLHPAEIDVSLIAIDGDFVIPAGASLEGIAGYYKVRIIARGGRIALPPSATHLTELAAETSNCAMLCEGRIASDSEHDGNREDGILISVLEEILDAPKAIPRPMPTPQLTPIVVTKRDRKRQMENYSAERLDDDTTEYDEECEEDYNGNGRITDKRDDQATYLRRHELALAFAERNTQSTRLEKDRESRILKDFCKAAGRLREKQKKLVGFEVGDGKYPESSGFIKQEYSARNLGSVELPEDHVNGSTHARENAHRRQKSQKDDIVRGLNVAVKVQQPTEQTRHHTPHLSVAQSTAKDGYLSNSKNQSFNIWPCKSPDHHFSSYATPLLGPSPHNFHYSHQPHLLNYPNHHESLPQPQTSSPSTISPLSSHTTPSPTSTDIHTHRNPIPSPPSSNSTTMSVVSTHHPKISTNIHHNNRMLRPIVSATSTAQSTPNNSPPVHGQQSNRNRKILSTSTNLSCYGAAPRCLSATSFNSLPPSASTSPIYPPSSPRSMASRIANSPPVTRFGVLSTPLANTKSILANSDYNPMCLTFGFYGFADNGGVPGGGYGMPVPGQGDSACTGDSLTLWVARAERCDDEGNNSAGSNPRQAAALTVQALIGSKIRKPDITVTLDEGERQILKATEGLPTKHSLVMAGGWLLGNYFYTATVGEAQILIIRDQRQEEKTDNGFVKSNALSSKRQCSPATSSSSLSENAIVSSNVNTAVHWQRRYIVGGRFASHASENDVASSQTIPADSPGLVCERSASNSSNGVHVSTDSTSILYDDSGSDGSQTCSSTSIKLPMTPPRTEPDFQSEGFSASNSRQVRSSSQAEQKNALLDTPQFGSTHPNLSKVAGTGRHALRTGDVIVLSTGDVRRVLLQEDVLDEAVRFAKVDARKAAEYLVGLWRNETDHAKEFNFEANVRDEVVLVAVVT